MKRDRLTPVDAARILFGYQIEYDDFDSQTAQFSSGADVCEALAAHFGFDDEDYRIIRDGLVRQRQLRDERAARRQDAKP